MGQIKNAFEKAQSKDIALVFNDDANALLERMFKQRTIEKGTFFLRQGEPSTEMALVISGLFRSYYIDDNGNDITKYFYPEHAKLFSYKAYIRNELSEYSIQALEDSMVAVTKISDFEQAAKNNSQLLWYYKETLDEMMLMKEEQACHLKMLTGSQRYQAFLSAYPGLEERVKQYQIASFLGLTPVSLSRIKKQAHINK